MSFKGQQRLALLPTHLSGKSFASLELRLDSVAGLLHSHGVEADFLGLPNCGIHDDWGSRKLPNHADGRADSAYCGCCGGGLGQIGVY